MHKEIRYTLIVGIVAAYLILSGCQSPGPRSQIASAHVASDEQIKNGNWTVLADLPVARFGGAGAVVQGKFHLFGGVNMNPHTPEGQDRARAVDLHHLYDPATNEWTAAAPMPDKKGWPAIAVYQDKIYLFGGDNLAIDRSMTASAWVYDPKQDAYQDIAPLPHPRSYCYAVTVGDYIHIFGARTLRSDGQADRSTFRYDPRQNTYTRTADLPEGARFIVHGSHNGCIYAVHGETDREVYADGVLKYNVAADQWTKLNIPRLEQRKWYLSQHSTHAAIDSKLFILGGWSRVTNTRSDRAAYFDMTTETFGEVARMPRGRCCGVCGVIDGKLYLAGGFWQWVDDVHDCQETWAFVPQP
jgi:N-acetylneuraminic acid mutarotase